MLTSCIAGGRLRKAARCARLLALLACIVLPSTGFAQGTGSAALSWTPPTHNTNGSPLTDLTSYRIYWRCGTGSGYPFSVTIPAPASGHVVTGLPGSARCFFSSTALNAAGVESVFSNESVKDFGLPLPGRAGVVIDWWESAMSVGLNADTDLIGITANLPDDQNFTAAGWSYVVSDSGAVSQPIVWLIDGSVSGSAIFWDASDDVMYVLDLVTGSAASAAAFASRPATGAWFAWYLRCSGTGANQLEAGWRAEGSSAWVTATATHADTTPAFFLLGPITGAPIVARFGAAKVWDAVLTDQEIYANTQFVRAIRRTNLRYEWPLASATDTRDLSGNGYSPSITSGTTELGPPIPWAPPTLAMMGMGQ